jgi:hypothetical protein
MHIEASDINSVRLRENKIIKARDSLAFIYAF